MDQKFYKQVSEVSSALSAKRLYTRELWRGSVYGEKRDNLLFVSCLDELNWADMRVLLRMHPRVFLKDLACYADS